MLAVSIETATCDFEGSASSKANVPENFEKRPRALATTRWRTENATLEWTASIVKFVRGIEGLLEMSTQGGAYSGLGARSRRDETHPPAHVEAIGPARLREARAPE